MGTKMFKIGSFEAELAKSMEENLVSNGLENKHNFDKIAKAADFLNAAAEIFDDTGFHAEAEVITQVLEKLANNGMRKVAQSIDDLTPEEMKFYQKLPAHSKASLDALIKKTPTGLDVSDFVEELKLLYNIRKDPDVIEFESKLHKGNPLAGGSVVDFADASNAADKKTLNFDSNEVKGDRFTENMTPDKMVKNILETGTPFDYINEDFNKVPAIEVGDRDIPDRDVRYIDKTFEDEE